MTATEVFRADANVAYEWATFVVYEHPLHPGAYVTSWNSGCSCNWYEPPTDDALRTSEPMSRVAAHQQLVSFLSRFERSYFTPAETVRHLERFQTTMPRATT